MLYECVNCEFYVAAGEKFCPDCGLAAPAEPLKIQKDDFDRPLMLKIAAITAIVIVLGIGAYRVREGTGDFSDWAAVVITVLLLSLVFSFFVAPFITRRATRVERQRRFPSANAPTNFQFVQETTFLRNHDLKTRLNDFGTAAKKGISQRADFGKSRVPIEKIELLNLSARYDLLNSRIELARLHNELRAIIEQRGDSSGREERVEWLGEITAELELLNLALTDDFAGQISETIREDKRNLLAEVAETEKFCAALSKSRTETEPFQADLERFFVEDFTNRIKNSDARKTLFNLTEAFAAAEVGFRS